ncbi:hypothetical protein ACFYY1_28045 [Streptomyces sp. NPDC001890]|uniref:hypothetical protein n=1 Tax=Streptomyces sp. NPDC001890 TaxID=3364620 RepID=UPI003688CEDC
MAIGLASEQSAVRRNAEPADLLAQHAVGQRWYVDGTCGHSGGSSDCGPPGTFTSS